MMATDMMMETIGTSKDHIKNNEILPQMELDEDWGWL